ncbi:type II secretion system protein GspJ [Pseudomonas sp. Teo4]|uniref:type II secretion system protein GspJ n=1 Tax=Pseudomonas sp. Teo4 TaxID=3064528 RepID=UPI002AB9E2EC|nr:type II secretion system protein GspJ [Pseudomonas sp. Teo4]MDZ3994217.1 Type II secretion system protein J [Pseudomonas sp. Teo4]
MSPNERGACRRQRGFTLLELLLALAIFALLALGSATLFSTLVRTEAALQRQADELRALGRAMSLIQRDAWQGVFPTSLEATGYAVSLDRQRLRWMLSDEASDSVAAGSHLRVVEYWFEEGALWRRRRSLEQGEGRPQRLLDNVSELRWRLHVPGQGWTAQWPGPERHALVPNAIEVTISSGRFQRLRRLLPLAGVGR